MKMLIKIAFLTLGLLLPSGLVYSMQSPEDQRLEFKDLLQQVRTIIFYLAAHPEAGVSPMDTIQVEDQTLSLFEWEEYLTPSAETYPYSLASQCKELIKTFFEKTSSETREVIEKYFAHKEQLGDDKLWNYLYNKKLLTAYNFAITSNSLKDKKMQLVRFKSRENEFLQLKDPSCSRISIPNNQDKQNVLEILTKSVHPKLLVYLTALEPELLPDTTDNTIERICQNPLIPLKHMRICYPERTTYVLFSKPGDPPVLEEERKKDPPVLEKERREAPPAPFSPETPAPFYKNKQLPIVTGSSALLIGAGIYAYNIKQKKSQKPESRWEKAQKRMQKLQTQLVSALSKLY